jgi:hypothetical protein
MAPILVAQQVGVVLGVGAVRHRPEHRIAVVGIDVLIDRDDAFAARALERRRGIERAPDLGFRRLERDLDDDDAALGLADFTQLHSHADAMDLGVGREHADDDGKIVMPPGRPSPSPWQDRAR